MRVLEILKNVKEISSIVLRKICTRSENVTWNISFEHPFERSTIKYVGQKYLGQ